MEKLAHLPQQRRADEVWILLEWDDLMRARHFAESDDLIDDWSAPE